VPNLTRSDKFSAERFQTGPVLVLSVCHFIHDAYSSFLAPLLPLLIAKLGITLTQAGFLSTVMQIPAIFNPLIGSLADRISTRYFIILAPATTAIPMSLLGLAPNYGVLLVLLFCAGVSVAMFHVPSPVMISRLSGSRVGQGMSFYMTGGEFARTVGPLVAIGSVSLFGLEGAYPIMIVGVLASLWLYLRFREVPVGNPQKRRTPLGEAWRDIRHILIPLIAILVTRGFMHAAVATFLPTYIRAETGNLWLAGFCLTLFEASGVVGVMTTGSLSDFIGRRKMLALSILGAPLGLFLFIELTGWYRFIALIFTGFTLLSTTPVMLALVQENAKKSPAAANGFFMMSSFLARSAIVVLVGFAGDMIGLRTTYLISAALGMAGLPFIRMLPRR